MALGLQTLMPTVPTPTSQTIVTDIDGDGTNELIIFDTNSQQLSIIHQFKYSDFTLNKIAPSIWPESTPGTTSTLWNDSTLRWQTLWSAQGTIPGGWGIQFDDVIVAADLDGDGIDELFIYNLTTLEWGILQWNSTAGQLQIIYQISVAPSNRVVIVGDLNWPGSASDQYFIIPNMHGLVPAVPAKAAGILLFNSQSLAMGMISYSASQNKFLQWWNHSGSSLPGWNLSSTDQFYVADFANAGTPAVTVYQHPPGQGAFIDLLSWNGSNFAAPSAQGHGVGGWRFGSTDQIQCADLDGDGMAEILIYNGGTQDLGVLKWENGSFQAPAVKGQIGSGSNVWNIGRNDKYFCVNGSAGNPGPIYAYSPDSQQVAVLNYQSGNFTCLWSGSSLSPNNGWPVSADDSFYAGRPWDSASPTLFTLSKQGTATSPVLMLGAATWGTAPLQIASSAKVPVLGWSPAFLASAPSTNFTPFTQGDQPAIYAYISSQFPIPGQLNSKPPTDVRSLYTNMPDDDKWQTYGSDLQGVSKSPSQVPSTWQPAPDLSWNTSDWQTVVKTIAAECNQVDTVYSLYAGIQFMANALHAFQKHDLETVKSNIEAVAKNNSNSAVAYWFGQATVAILWGLAAAATPIFGEALAAAGGVFLSMGASLLGSGLSYDPTQQKSLVLKDLKQEITNTTVSSIVSESMDLTIFLQDPVKMNITNELSQGEWAMPTSLPSTVQQPFSATDRLVMYQQLIPAYFSIRIFQSAVVVNPLFSLNGNQYTLWPVDDPSSITLTDWQSSQLYADLFTTLGVSQTDFFVGNGPWAAIPRKTASGIFVAPGGGGTGM